MRYRVRGTARQDAHTVEGDDGGGSERVQPDDHGAEVIQITPQMKILVAIEAVDGRKGIDSLARLCEEKPSALFRSDPPVLAKSDPLEN